MTFAYTLAAPSRTALAATALFTATLLPSDATAQPTIASDRLFRIASWNLEDAAAAGIVTRPEPQRGGWRNTFGAERRLESSTDFDGRRLGADVVLLQGVRSIKEVRKIFPARDWKLIVSRQILRLGDGRLNRQTRLARDDATTAVAVRYQRALRVTAIEHLLDLGKASDSRGESEPSSTAANEAPTLDGDGAETGAGLAVRIVYQGAPVWTVSATLPGDCAAAREGCAAAASLDRWAKEKREAGFGVVLAGRLAPELRKGRVHSACASQELIADNSIKGSTGADSIAGCMTFVEFDP